MSMHLTVDTDPYNEDDAEGRLRDIADEIAAGKLKGETWELTGDPDPEEPTDMDDDS